MFSACVALAANTTRSGWPKPRSDATRSRATITVRAAPSSPSAAPRPELPSSRMARATASITHSGRRYDVAAQLRYTMAATAP